LIENGATININNNNDMPLIIACIDGNYNIVKLLIENGATIDINDGYWCPLSYACRYGHYNIVKLLIEKGATINIKTGYPLSDTCETKQYEIVKLLLSHLPQIMKSYISYDLYKSYDINIRKILNNYNSLIYQLDGIRYLPDIVTFNSGLFIGIL
jgi:hypothetical protein